MIALPIPGIIDAWTEARGTLRIRRRVRASPAAERAE
jgi:hypothetical protein